MKRRRLPILACGLFLASCAAVSPVPRDTAHDTTSDLAACIRSRSCHREFVVDRRGFGFEGFGAPENSRKAASLAVQLAGAQFIVTPEIFYRILFLGKTRYDT